MADNVQLATGPLVVATRGDAANVQHQAVVPEFLSGGGIPIPVSVGSPSPTSDTDQIALLTAILIELRVRNELAYSQVWPEVEPLESLRAKYKDFPVTL